MASWLVHLSPECSPSSSPGQGHCVVFLGKTFYPHCPSLSTQVHINGLGTCKHNAVGNPVMESLASHPGGSRDMFNNFMLQKLR